MEKEALISNLKQRIGETDFAVLSEKTLDNIIPNFLPMFAEDDKITEETYKLPVSILKSHIGQYRHDVAEAIKSNKATWESEQKTAQDKAIADAIAKAKAEWEEKNKSKPVEDKKEGEEKDLSKLVESAIAEQLKTLTGDDGAIGKLTKQFSDYVQNAENEKRVALIAKMKDDLKSYLIDERLAEREPVVNLAIKELAIDEKSDLDKLKVEVEKKYESLFKELYGDGGRPFAGGNGSGGGDNTEDFKNFLKEREAAAAQSAKDEEALKSLLK